MMVLFASTLCLVRSPLLRAPPYAPVAVRWSGRLLAQLEQQQPQIKLSKRAVRKLRGASRDASTAAAATPPSAATKHAENDAGAGDDLASRVNKLTKLNQPHKVLELYNATAADERPEALPLVVRALLRMRCVEAALALHRRHSSESTAPLDTRSACVLFLALCRTGRLDEATEMLSELERSHPPPEQESVAAKIVKAMNAAGGEVGGGMMASSSAAPMEDAVEEPMWHAISSTMVPALALARVEAGEVDLARELATRLGKPAAALPPEHSLVKLIRNFGRARDFRGVYACLDAQAYATPQQEWGSEGLQAMVDALVRSVRFVKGGVSMGTLPEAPYPEVCFIGRSNVGKSSLTNFLVGRRAIAYTSKTPGKTQQYNYFVLNELAEGVASSKRGRKQRENDDDDGRVRFPQPTNWQKAGTFHLVDLPGLGYAKVPGASRKKWLQFLGQYCREREQLKMVVHLIDGEIGPLETDLMIMRMVRDAAKEGEEAATIVAEDSEEEEAVYDSAEAVARAEAALTATGGDEAAAEAFAGGGAGGWQYAVVLTKVDKGGRKAARKAEAKVRAAIEETGCPQPLGVVVTSASKKVGRAAAWRLMRRLVLGSES